MIHLEVRTTWINLCHYELLTTISNLKMSDCGSKHIFKIPVTVSIVFTLLSTKSWLLICQESSLVFTHQNIESSFCWFNKIIFQMVPFCLQFLLLRYEMMFSQFDLTSKCLLRTRSGVYKARSTMKLSFSIPIQRKKVRPESYCKNMKINLKNVSLSDLLLK